jgi:hypothetical protein
MTCGALASCLPASARLLDQGPEQHVLGSADAGGQAYPPVQQILSGKPKKLRLMWHHHTRVTLTHFKTPCSTLDGRVIDFRWRRMTIGMTSGPRQSYCK